MCNSFSLGFTSVAGRQFSSQGQNIQTITTVSHTSGIKIHIKSSSVLTTTVWENSLKIFYNHWKDYKTEFPRSLTICLWSFVSTLVKQELECKIFPLHLRCSLRHGWGRAHGVGFSDGPCVKSSIFILAKWWWKDYFIIISGNENISITYH